MEYKKIVNVRVATMLNTNGLYFELTEENGNAFGINDIPDDFLIKILKNKGYKITKEF